MTNHEKKLSRAIIRTPGKSFVEGLTTVDLGSPDFNRVLEQHDEYCAALEKCGLTLTRLPADERHPDSTFVEDAAVLITASGHSGPDGLNAIVTRPGAVSRLGEVAGIRQSLAKYCSQLHSIREPGTLDGGDVCEAGNHFFIGISERTNETGAQQLAELVKSFGYSSSFVDIRDLKNILHLKSGLAYLGDNRLVVIEALANHKAFSGYDLIHVQAGEEYAANCVRINDHVFIAAGYPMFEATLRQLGYKTLALAVTEFQKMDGGLSCLSLRF